VIWFQGCGLGCPGCFNPATHPHAGGFRVGVGELLRRIGQRGDEIEGVTVSGGEPFEQGRGLLALVRGLRSTTGLGVLVFSGLTIEEIRNRPLGEEVLERIDALVAGRFVARLAPGRGLRGSSNQRVHLLSERYRAGELDRAVSAEILIDPAGRISVTGIDPPRSAGRT
jgi:anaerobic ribonucleoside-triphosphate reductase activating protein